MKNAVSVDLQFHEGPDTLPIRKGAVVCRFKEIKGLRGAVLVYAA
jgi:hypothetical protein